MIYVECKSDFALVKSITGIPRREITHEGGKPRVCQRLERQENCKGLVDEDPSRAQPRYIRKLRLANDLFQYELRELCDESRNNRLIILCPKLEDWILKAAKEADLRMKKYGLPDTPRELHQVINLDPRKLERLLPDLKNLERVKTLRKLLGS